MSSPSPQSVSSNVSYPSSLAGFDCYPVSYEVHNIVPYLDPAWLVAAIIFGLLIGSLLAQVLFRFCLRRWWEKEFEEDRHVLMQEHKNAPPHRRFMLFCFPFWYMKLKKVKNGEVSPAGAMMEPKAEESENGSRPSTSCSRLRPESRNRDREDGRVRGMVDSALQDTIEEAKSELYQQDVIATDEIEWDILEKRKQISERLALIHMNQKSEGTKAEKEAIEKVLTEFRDKMTQAQIDMELNLRAKIQAMKTDPEFIKNEQKLTEAIQAMKASHRRRLHVLFKDHLNALRESVRNYTKMSETDIDDLIVKLRSSLADLESHLADIILMQNDQLEINGAQRHFLLEQLKTNETDLDQEQKHTVNSAGKILQQIFQQGKLGEAEKEKLLHDLTSALSLVREKHRSTVKSQLDQIGMKLRKERTERLGKMKQRQNEQLMKLMGQSEAMTDSAQFLQAVRELLDQQSDQKAEVKADLDKEEASKLRQAYARVEQSWKEALQHEMEKFIGRVQTAVKLSSSEASNILRGHEIDTREWEKMREMEKKVTISELRSKMDERKAKTQCASARKDSEQRRLTKQQDDMIQRVLEAQRDLEDGDRRQILVEHGHNQDLLGSILLLTKLRQDQIVARTLTERKLKLRKENETKTEGKEKKRERKWTKRVDDGRENKEEEIEMAHLNWTLEEEKDKLMQEIRDRIAVETKAMMEQQEANMAVLIGRLQVGHARRQIFLERQDQLVNKMETELKQQVQNLPPPDPNGLEQLMMEHRRQVDNLNKALEESRHRQLQILRERLEEKRLRTKQNLEAKFEAEEEEILTRSFKTKMSFASTLLCQNKLTARHQKALEQLETQTKSELERQKEMVNKQMQKELERILVEQKKQFLGQLASLCKMSPDEIKAMSRAAQDVQRRPDQALPPVNDPSSADSVAIQTSENGPGRLPPLDRTNIRPAPLAAQDETGDSSTPKRRRKKKNKRAKQAGSNNDTDSL